MELQRVSAVVLTHLTPKRMPSLRALLQRLGGQQRTQPLDIHLSNPALQLLRSSLGAQLLSMTLGQGHTGLSSQLQPRERMPGACSHVSKLRIVLAGEDESGAALLSAVNLVAARPGDQDSLEVGTVRQLISPISACKTPPLRW